MSERARALLVGVLVWVAATLIESSIVVAQEGAPFLEAFLGAGFNYGVLGLLAYGVWRLCGWSLSTDRGRPVVIATHVALFVFGVVLWQAIYIGTLYLVTGPSALLPIKFGGLWYLLTAATTYGLMTVAILGVRLSRRLREQQRRAAELTILAREAEVRALRAQLRPHFLFNVLNSIYSLVESRPQQAKEMVALVGRLMQQTLEVADEERVPLEWELDCVRTYLSIESVRLGDRMAVRFSVEDDLLDFPVPPFILQPLVENAVKHGVSPGIEPVTVDIEARRFNAGVGLFVRDSGPGSVEPIAAGTDGRGLELTRNRLHSLYGEGAALELRNGVPRGFEVEVRIPHD